MKDKLTEMQHEMTTLQKQLLKQVEKDAQVSFNPTSGAMILSYYEAIYDKLLVSAFELESPDNVEQKTLAVFNYELYGAKLSIVREMYEYKTLHEEIKKETYNRYA